MKLFHFQMECKGVERLPNGKGVKIRGFASTPDIDRSRDIVLPSAFAKSLAEYQKSSSAPALLRSHNPDRVVGSIVMEGEDAPVISDKGMAITAIVTEKETADQVEAGEMRTFSIGYICTQKKYDIRPTGRYEKATGQELYVEVRILEELDWVETSIVSTPDNKNAIFTVEKSATKMFDSLPSSTMEHKCSIYPNEKAVYKIGDRWLSQKAVEEMQFKGAKPLTAAEVEAKSFESKEMAQEFMEDTEVKGASIIEKEGKFHIKYNEEKKDAKTEEKSVVCVVIEGDDEAAAKAYIAEQKMSDKNMKKQEKGYAFPQMTQDAFDVSTVEVKEIKDGVKHIVATKLEKKEEGGDAPAGDAGTTPKPQAQAGDAATPAEKTGAEVPVEKTETNGGQAGDEGKQAASVEQKSAMKLMMESMRDAKAISVTDEEIKSLETVVDSNALNGALFIMTKMATAMQEQHKTIDLLKQALSLIPLHKGKTIHGLLQNGTVVTADGATTPEEKQAKVEAEQKDTSFRSWLLGAKNGTEISIGSDE